MLEAALGFPVFLLVLFLGIELVRAANVATRLQEGVHRAGRYAALGLRASNDPEGVESVRLKIEELSGLSVPDDLEHFNICPNSDSCAVNNRGNDEDWVFIRAASPHRTLFGGYELDLGAYTMVRNEARFDTPPQSGGGGGSGCFAAGTLIDKADGEKAPIEIIAPGDLVLAYSEKDQSRVVAQVSDIMQPRMVESYYLINGSIRVTGEHPFYVNGSWVKAQELVPGDLLRGTDDMPVIVGSIEYLEAPLKVHNFNVADFHNYYAAGVLVHNKRHSEQATPEIIPY